MSGADILGERKVNGRCLTMNTDATQRLEMRWLPVVDPAGRARMEATWVAIPAAVAPRETAVTHAA
jgi:hypothetical protein